MHRASLLSTLIGAFFLVMAFAAPTVLRWQTEFTLRKIDASAYVDLVVSMNLERWAFDLLISKVLSIALLVSGILMLRRLKAGLFLGLATYAVCICVALYSFIALQWALLPLFKTLAWVYAFYYVITAHRQHGANWWHQTN